jgi:uncharacterized protein YneF (UPF0154 family)
MNINAMLISIVTATLGFVGGMYVADKFIK